MTSVLKRYEQGLFYKYKEVTIRRFITTMQRYFVLLPLAGLLLLPVALGAAEAVTDIGIADRVEDELAMDPAVPSYQIDVAVSDGIVTLGGTVDNAPARERAVRLAETVKGVRGVVSAVEGPAGTGIPS